MGTGKSTPRKFGKETILDKNIINEYREKGFLQASIIIEMAGAPKEHLVEKISNYINFLIKEAKDIKLITVNLAKPKKNKKEDKLFGIYAELDILFKDASTLAFFCFDYMPSSIEITHPEQFSYRASDFAAFFNDMLERIYRLDIVLKNLKAKETILEKNAGLLLRNNIILSLKDKDKEIAELSKNTGIPEDQLVKFLDKLLKEEWINKKNNKYSVNTDKVKVQKN